MLVRVLAATHGLALVSLDPPTHLPARDVVCGDVVRLDDAGTRIVEVIPRRSALTRARLNLDDDAGVQIICANVDIVAVCAPLDRPVSARFLERGVAIAHASGARPLVLLTKRDLVDTESAIELPGVDVLAISAHDEGDLEVVRALVAPGETMALLGASGAGKSTLANALLGAGAAGQRTAAVRADDARGRHTTTGARLFALPWGAFLVDTAGVRTLGLAGDEDDVAAAFPDIDALAVGCRFRDCSHHAERGCAVRDVVDEGRLASFHALVREARRRGRAPWEPDAGRTLSLAARRYARDKRR